jgi:predicted NBD/HSP70 family sugar kinase
MALGEHWTNWAAVDHLLFIKVGTGIGCGIVVAGRIHRGAEGAAGDIGHIRVAAGDEADAIVCSCGNVGCLEALAGGGAMAARLRDQGLDTADSRAVVELARAGEPAAVRLVRESGRLIGEVLAASVNLYNPSVIVIGGDVAQAHEQLLAGVREVVYQRSLPLATRHLRVVRTQLADRAGVIGAAVMVIEQVLSPAAIDAAIAAQGPHEARAVPS